MVQTEIDLWAKQISKIILKFTTFIYIMTYNFNLMN
jgi:hypothetical protein